jgi:nicotinate-nucleotide pyrophosphorylase (carboxylating)
MAKADGVVSGTALADAAFREAGRGVRVKWTVHDGDRVLAGKTIAMLEGPMATLLLGERVALNFLQRMSGVATLTRAFVDVANGGKYKPGIFDTRKTTPLLRAWEKQAVLHGGGQSHRFALYDMAMLKDNHIDAAGSISTAVGMLEANGFFKRRPQAGLCIEVRNTAEAVEATRCRADIILLDNMTPAEIRTAAVAVCDEAKRAGRAVPELEISGGITLRNLKKYADLPVQRISVGALTHSAPALDISMRYLK